MEKKSVITIKKSSFSFMAERNTTLLDAALKENINLPHGCKSGACGTCIANVIEGNIKNKGPETTKISKTILLCQSYAASKKIVLEYPTEKLNMIKVHSKNKKVINPKDFLLQVVGNKSVTPLIKELSFFVPPKLNLQFLAGAHMEIYNNRNDISKKYSIVNSPGKLNNLKKNILKFLITKNDRKGISQFIHNEVKVGDILRVKGPFFSFQYSINNNKPILGIAGGSGLSPILSIIKDILHKNIDLSIILFLSVRNREEILEMDTLHKLKQEYKSFSFKIALTREKPIQNSQFLFGRVNSSLQKIFKDLSTHQILIAGSEKFVETSYDHVIKLSANKNNIFYEKFTRN